MRDLGVRGLIRLRIGLLRIYAMEASPRSEPGSSARLDTRRCRRSSC
jgi:hypothetical protein